MAGLTAPEDDIDNSASRTQTGAPRYSRRLSDKILLAFHHACDQGDYEIAEQLLRILESMLTRRTVPPDANRRKSIESLVAAHERLWHLRHPEESFS
jgi:ankyrin repeat protein